MSQKKVDQYKEYKANKKKILKREKIKKKFVDYSVYLAILVIGTAVLTVAVGQIMYKYKAYKNSRPNYNVTEKVFDDMVGVLTTKAETQPATEEGSEGETGSEKESGSEKETEKETESVKESESEKESEKESESEKASEKESESEKASEKESESEKATE
ncbi:MAG: hypothetical protein J5825_06940 [Lachnospiraceae bacterium]|nr:hypothetical protein [Lachnospiraceae bacterium]